MGWFSIHSGWSEPSVVGWPFPWRRCGFVGKLLIPFPKSSPSPTPPGHVTQLKTVSGRRWIAHCPPTLWSFFWMASSDPDDKPGGKRLPAAASGPLADGQAFRFPAWVLSRCVLCFFCLGAASCLCRAFSQEVILDQNNWQILIEEEDLIFFPSGVIFYTKMCRSKGIYEYSVRATSLKTWDAKLREERGDVETNHTVSLFLHLFLLQLFLSYWSQIFINTKGSSEGDKMRKGLSLGRWKSSLGSSDWVVTWAQAWELEHVLNFSFL